MEGARRQAVVLSLIEKMYSNGSWCGETHIQKSIYFLQEMLGVPTDFDYILYKHVPFSFGLSDLLLAQRANLFVKLHNLPSPYAPSNMRCHLARCSSGGKLRHSQGLLARIFLRKSSGLHVHM